MRVCACVCVCPYEIVLFSCGEISIDPSVREFLGLIFCFSYGHVARDNNNIM